MHNLAKFRLVIFVHEMNVKRNCPAYVDEIEAYFSGICNNLGCFLRVGSR